MLSKDDGTGKLDKAVADDASENWEPESHSLGVDVVEPGRFVIELLLLPWNEASKLEAEDFRRIPGRLGRSISGAN
jgi:hypothetical protein